MGNDVALRPETGLVTENDAQMIQRVKGRIQTLHTIYKEIMVKGDAEKGIDGDYGLIPGCGNKPALKKAGAEKLILGFHVAPTVGENIKMREYDGGHREVTVVCTLTGMGGEVLGEGVGSCSTMESKYRYRSVADYEVQDCEIPQDSKERKNEYRKQGFGMKKVDGIWRWVKYGDDRRTENPDIADTYNTVLKMAKKRALVDACLTVFGASDLFTQDIDELPPNGAVAPEKAAPPEAPKTPAQPSGKADDPGPLDMDATLQAIEQCKTVAALDTFIKGIDKKYGATASADQVQSINSARLLRRTALGGK
jgi:hypothetical protein